MKLSRRNSWQISIKSKYGRVSARSEGRPSTMPISSSSFCRWLWRCAVARDPITRMVELGPRLSKLTALLRADDPGKQEEFAVFLRLLDESPMARNAVLTVPVPMRNLSRRGYAMVGYGVEVSWVSDRRGVSQESAPWILKEDGTWLIEIISGSRSFPWRQAVTKATSMTAALYPKLGLFGAVRHR